MGKGLSLEVSPINLILGQPFFIQEFKVWFLSFLEGFLCAASFLLSSSSSLLADSPPPIPLQPIILSLENVKSLQLIWHENYFWVSKDSIVLMWSAFAEKYPWLYGSHRDFLLDNGHSFTCKVPFRPPQWILDPFASEVSQMKMKFLKASSKLTRNMMCTHYHYYYNHYNYHYH